MYEKQQRNRAQRTENARQNQGVDAALNIQLQNIQEHDAENQISGIDNHAQNQTLLRFPKTAQHTVHCCVNNKGQNRPRTSREVDRCLAQDFRFSIRVEGKQDGIRENQQRQTGGHADDDRQPDDLSAGACRALPVARAAALCDNDRAARTDAR